MRNDGFSALPTICSFWDRLMREVDMELEGVWIKSLFVTSESASEE